MSDREVCEHYKQGNCPECNAMYDRIVNTDMERIDDLTARLEKTSEVCDELEQNYLQSKEKLETTEKERDKYRKEALAADQWKEVFERSLDDQKELKAQLLAMTDERDELKKASARDDRWWNELSDKYEATKAQLLAAQKEIEKRDKMIAVQTMRHKEFQSLYDETVNNLRTATEALETLLPVFMTIASSLDMGNRQSVALKAQSIAREALEALKCK